MLVSTVITDSRNLQIAAIAKISAQMTAARSQATRKEISDGVLFIQFQPAKGPAQIGVKISFKGVGVTVLP